MKKAISRKTSGYLLSVAVAAASAVIALPASAYNLHSDNGTELNLDVEAIFGTFSSDENYFGKSGNQTQNTNADNTYFQVLAIVPF